MPFPRTTASSGDDSFNTERLDEQNSAENIRNSMQKYLQSKQQHLRFLLVFCVLLVQLVILVFWF